MERSAPLKRALGGWDLALIVVGSVIGSGIFRTPAVVAQRLHVPWLLLAAWAAGGLVALFGAFVLGELGARRPMDCGPYAYLSDALHPVVGFAYGWAFLLAAGTGGLAASAVLFGGYFNSLTGVNVSSGVVAATALALLATVNAFGVREGANVQNGLTLLKVAALMGVVVAGMIAHPASSETPLPLGSTLATLRAFSIAMIPVLFAYSGPQIANFMAAESKDPARALPAGLTVGMIAVAVVYVLVNAVCVRVLGPDGLARTDVPVAQVLAQAFGAPGMRLTSIAIALSTLGYISNRMLAVPRLYHAMADDGLFFRVIARVNPRTQVPVIAVGLQAVIAIVISLTSGYEHILNFVVAIIYGFGGLLAIALFVVRARDARTPAEPRGGFRVPLHPYSTAIFMLASFGVTIATCVAYPVDGFFGLGICLSAIPAYILFARAGEWAARSPARRSP
jgi:basic amino acid/polyamine antiporter, APA family